MSCGAAWLATAALCLLSAGCSVVRNPTPVSALPPPAEAGEVKYLISPGDDLEVRFFHTPDLNVLLPVRPDGYISMPLAHEVRAAGRTAESLRQELLERYANELEDPEIAVIIRTFSGHRVHVGGEVDSPGVFPYVGTMTVLDSVFAAGGMLETARPQEVLVVRRDPQDGYLVIPVNLKHVLDGTAPSQNVVLAPFDAVYVPASPVAHLNDFVELYIRRNLPIDFTLRFNLN